MSSKFIACMLIFSVDIFKFNNMKHPERSEQPALSHVEPVLAVRNVPETVAYWHEVLAFPEKWIWDPPNHGGVSWQGATFIQFGENPALADVSEGHSVWIRAHNIESLYELHKRLGANIVSPLERQTWNCDQYTVRDINGYYVHFAQPSAIRNRGTGQLPDSVRLAARKPSVEENARLMTSVGWEAPDEAPLELASRSIVYALVAEDIQTGEAVGCAFLLGDNESFYYVKNVIVHRAWQGRRIGTMMMKELVRWLEANVRGSATVGLFTGDHLASFYKQFGFIQACGMYRQVGK